jgi:hypothetical protein
MRTSWLFLLTFLSGTIDDFITKTIGGRIFARDNRWWPVGHVALSSQAGLVFTGDQSSLGFHKMNDIEAGVIKIFAGSV